jgi:uncharacterized integral membrane protein (TIGR00697 family)
MQIEDKIYTFLCSLFAIIVIVGNLTYQKFIVISILPFHIFEFSVGVLLYPFAFLITDLIAELYGKARANFCVRNAVTVSCAVFAIIYGMDSLEATEWSKVDSETFHRVFGMYGVAFASSLVACYISQNIDIRIYLWIKRLSDNKHLWLRNVVSTGISLFIDTLIVTSILCIFGIIPFERMESLIFNGYTFKLLVVLCNVPVLYICVYGIRKLARFPRD